MNMALLNVGKPKTVQFNGKDVETGFYKEPVKGKLYLTKLNFEGDGQADLRYHGGPDKAVCVYPLEHYTYWRYISHCRSSCADHTAKTSVF